VIQLEDQYLGANFVTTVHEVIHGLGFSADAIKYFLDEKGVPRGKGVLKS